MDGKLRNSISEFLDSLEKEGKDREVLENIKEKIKRGEEESISVVSELLKTSKNKGYSFTAEDVFNYLKEEASSSLSDEALSKASGGTGFNKVVAGIAMGGTALGAGFTAHHFMNANNNAKNTAIVRSNTAQKNIKNSKNEKKALNKDGLAKDRDALGGLGGVDELTKNKDNSYSLNGKRKDLHPEELVDPALGVLAVLMTTLRHQVVLETDSVQVPLPVEEVVMEVWVTRISLDTYKTPKKNSLQHKSLMHQKVKMQVESVT